MYLTRTITTAYNYDIAIKTEKGYEVIDKLSLKRKVKTEKEKVEILNHYKGDYSEPLVLVLSGTQETKMGIETEEDFLSVAKEIVKNR